MRTARLCDAVCQDQFVIITVFVYRSQLCLAKVIVYLLIKAFQVILGRRIAELKSEYDIRLFVLLRDGLTIIPTDDIVIKEKDILIKKFLSILVIY